MRVLFFGTPEFAVQSLKALENSRSEVIAAVTQPDRRKERGHMSSVLPVKEYAQFRGIKVMQPRNIKEEGFLSDLSQLNPDVIAVVAYGRILPPAILKLPLYGCVNVHASLLPKYRGAAPIQWAIIRGEEKTGVTTMLMDEGLDTGGILLQEETAIREDDNAMSLATRLAEMGGGLLSKTLDGLRDGTLKPMPQQGESSYAPVLKKDDGIIRWYLPAREIFNLVRGTYPWPGASCFFRKERVLILSSSVVDETAEHIPGRIERVLKEEVHVAAGKGILSLKQLKPEGKGPMSAAAFLCGRHGREGDCFDAA